MAFMILGIGSALLPLLLRLALKLRLGVPLLYSPLMLTIFHSWYQAHAALADGILFAMVGLVALSWLVTLAGAFGSCWRICDASCLPPEPLPGGSVRPDWMAAPPSAPRACFNRGPSAPGSAGRSF